MDHEKYMRVALREAEKAAEEGNAPFGAVIVADGKIISRGHDRVATTHDPTAHAELSAVRKLCMQKKSRNFRGCICYSTSEPCAMCLAACLKAKIDTFVYGAPMEHDANLYIRANYTISKFRPFKVTLVGGVLADECLRQRNSQK